MVGRFDSPPTTHPFTRIPTQPHVSRYIDLTCIKKRASDSSLCGLLASLGSDARGHSPACGGLRCARDGDCNLALATVSTLSPNAHLHHFHDRHHCHKHHAHLRHCHICLHVKHHSPLTSGALDSVSMAAISAQVTSRPGSLGASGPADSLRSLWRETQVAAPLRLL